MKLITILFYVLPTNEAYVFDALDELIKTPYYLTKKMNVLEGCKTGFNRIGFGKHNSYNVMCLPEFSSHSYNNMIINISLH